MKIGLIDSGIGGFTVLAQVGKYIPQAEFVYLADYHNAPYSEKTELQLQNILARNAEKLIKAGCDLICVACNTATVSSITRLRERFADTEFVGTVPAVKVAAKVLPAGAHVVVLATKHTAESKYLKELVRPYSQINFQLVGSTELVRAIEEWDEGKISKILSGILDSRFTIYDSRTNSKFKIDGVVFGCTHFPFVKKQIQEILGNDMQFFDGADGVARRVVELVGNEYLRSSTQAKQMTRFISTSEKISSEQLAEKWRFYSELLNNS